MSRARRKRNPADDCARRTPTTNEDGAAAGSVKEPGERIPWPMTPEEEAQYRARLAGFERPRLEMRCTIFTDQHGAIYIVQHGDQPPQLGINHDREPAPPMVVAATNRDYEQVTEAILYELDRRFAGDSRMGALCWQIRNQLQRLAPTGPTIRRRVEAAHQATTATAEKSAA